MNEEDAFARLDRHITQLEKRERWENANRLSLLWVHSMVGISAGLIMILNGTTYAFVSKLGEYAAWTTGMPAIVGGVILALGLMRRPRWILAELVGLIIIMLWDVAMAIGLFIVIVNPPPDVYVPKLYHVAIYAGYFALLLVHVLSLWAYKRTVV